MIVRSPASSANLGPGFDCFGIAWQCYNTIEYKLSDSLIISGCEHKYRNKNNLAYTAFCETLNYAGISADTIEINFLNTDIPVSRGMGSSSALICSSVVAANSLYSLGFDTQQLLDIATKIEGHPDNVAPALTGGFTASAMDNSKAVTVHFPLSRNLFFTLMIPDFELSTSVARSVLPQSYSRADAIFNLSHTALTIKALESGDVKLLNTAMQDKLHHPYRFKLIKNYELAKSAAIEAGASAVCISGAGSTLLAISDKPETTVTIKSALSDALPEWNVIPSVPDYDGTIIL